MQEPSVLMALMQDMQGTAAERLSLFEKLKAAGMVACEDPAELKGAEDMLRMSAAIEKERG